MNTNEIQVKEVKEELLLCAKYPEASRREKDIGAYKIARATSSYSSPFTTFPLMLTPVDFHLVVTY
jgi:hypothetical protein